MAMVILVLQWECLLVIRGNTDGARLILCSSVKIQSVELKMACSFYVGQIHRSHPCGYSPGCDNQQVFQAVADLFVRVIQDPEVKRTLTVILAEASHKVSCEECSHVLAYPCHHSGQHFQWNIALADSTPGPSAWGLFRGWETWVVNLFKEYSLKFYPAL